MAGRRTQTRREFLGNGLRVGAGAAAVAAFGPHRARGASGQVERRERVQVLLGDVREASEAAFARGDRRGVEIVTGPDATELRSSSGGEYVSAPLSLPFSATHLGLHWTVRSRSARALTVHVRTSPDGRSWSGWRELSIEAIAHLSGSASAKDAVPVHGHGDVTEKDSAQREIFASLVSGGRARAAQYRVSFPSSDDAALGAMTVTAINTVDGPRIATSATDVLSKTFECPDGTPFTVVTREGWGCDESLRFGRVRGKQGEIWPEMYVPSKKVVLHHTATDNDYLDAAAEVQAIYAYHARTLGWGDIGYHVLVAHDGTIFEGRHGRGEDAATREILSDDVVAGHVYAHNYGSTGIAVLGNFDEVLPDDPRLADDGLLMTAVEDLMTFECGRQFIVPEDTTDFLQSDGVWHQALANISGHKDSYNTACPGANLYPKLASLRERVATRLGPGSAPSFSDDTTAEATLQAPADIAAVWSSDGTTYQFCLEGWHKASNSEDITYLQGYEESTAYGRDSLAMQQLWSSTSSGSASWMDLPAGHYTLHVRTSGGRSEVNRTWLVEEAPGGGNGRPGKPKR